VTQVIESTGELAEEIRTGWSKFWFTPRDAATLGLIRCLAGCMLFYTHLVWSLDLTGFFGNTGRINSEFLYDFYRGPDNHISFAWSHFNLIHSPIMMWCVHLVVLVILLLFTIGLFSRVTSILSFLIAVSYAHRVPGTLFGLDQINIMLATYLMLGPSGDAYSVDRWLQRRASGVPLDIPAPTISGNIATRMIQIHLCVIYFFAATGKLQGDSWWDGMALWLALANYEYQTLDVTWLGRWPWLINLMTHVTLFWELSYSALIWPRLSRPFMLALAIPLHMGIAVCMGMITFGVIMLIANLAFVAPELIRILLDRRFRQAG